MHPDFPQPQPPALQAMEAFKTKPSFLSGKLGLDTAVSTATAPVALDIEALQERDCWHEDMLLV